MLFTFSLVAIYTANLASFLTNANSSFFSTKDFVEGRAPVPPSMLSIPQGTAIASYVERNIRTKLPDVSFRPCSNIDECIQMVVQRKAGATIYDVPFIEYLISERYCDIVEISSKPFFPQTSCWVLPKDSPYTKAFSDAIVAHRDDESFTNLVHDSIDPGKCPNLLRERNNRIGLRTNLGGLFILMSALIVPAVFIHLWRRCSAYLRSDVAHRKVESLSWGMADAMGTHENEVNPDPFVEDSWKVLPLTTQLSEVIRRHLRMRTKSKDRIEEIEGELEDG
eukprot:Plantae.Rhodophyta-Hildenbrandia_rubra.ctg36630.p1 GENE.Plantae.Rhodophyta-Hildenbrandia_rubra.ctg36630~~Plantae.Rhodophyta-Hildenbrandia_rubra.ctg36630.p1  ORF type:complete len:280 (-),score=23.92 Plantae.Rhodophyta-Hildenbrandia_rubra.ctg36630:964-1803(-)